MQRVRSALSALARHARDTLVVASADRREEGLDLARAIAIVGMVFINFPLMLARRGDATGGSALLAWLVHMPSGRASSLFVTLAGVGVSMMARRAWRTERGASRARMWEQVRVVQILLLRAACLVPAGILLHLIWSIDILHFYGVYLTLTALFFVFAPTWLLAIACVALIAGGVALEVWDPTLPHAAFTSPTGFLTDAFIDGVHPVFPWLAFMLYGVWLGRQELADPAFRRRAMAVSLLVFGLCEVTSLGTLSTLLVFDRSGATEEYLGLLGTSWTPDPLYVISASATATLIITASLSVVQHAQGRRWQSLLRPLLSTGQLALSIYVTHALAGGLLPRRAGIRSSLSIEHVVLYTLVFLTLIVIGSTVYRRFLARGPLEWAMRLLSSFPSPSRPVARPESAPRAPRSARVTGGLALTGAVLVLALVSVRVLGRLPSPAAITVGSRTLSSLSLLQMRDTHTFALEAPTDVVLATHSGLDLYLELYQDGVLLSEDDDSGPGVDARIERSLQPGVYQVVVRPYSATTGPFVLELATAQQTAF